MKRYFTLEKAPVYIKFFITLALFMAIKDMHEIDSFSHLVVALLEFIIILELVRILIEFLFSDENRVKMRLMIDSTIIFFISDIMLIAHDTFEMINITSILGNIAILFILRVLSMKYSPATMEK